MELINSYYIFSSNASKKTAQMASVTIRNSAGDIIARIHSERSQPLRFLRKWPHCKERLDLIDQLRQNGVKQEDMQAIWDK